VYNKHLPCSQQAVPQQHYNNSNQQYNDITQQCMVSENTAVAEDPIWLGNVSFSGTAHACCCG